MSKKVVLYDIASRLSPDRSFSLHTLRTRLALNYLRVPYETVWLSYADIASTLAGLGHGPSSGPPWTNRPVYTLPMLQVGTVHFPSSHGIADYLASAYPQPQLFPHQCRPLVRAIKSHITERILPVLAPLVVPHIPAILDDRGAAYFRTTRERWHRQPLERMPAVFGGEPALRDRLRSRLLQFEKMAHEYRAPWLLGDMPCYADFCIIALLGWIEPTRKDVHAEMLDQYKGLRRLWEAGQQYMGPSIESGTERESDPTPRELTRLLEHASTPVTEAQERRRLNTIDTLQSLLASASTESPAATTDPESDAEPQGPATKTEDERPVAHIHNTFHSPLQPKERKKRSLTQAGAASTSMPMASTNSAIDAEAQDRAKETEDERPVAPIHNTFHSPLPPKKTKKRSLAQAAAASTSIPMATTNPAIDAEAQDSAKETEDERAVTPINTFRSPLPPKKKKQRFLAQAVPIPATDPASDAAAQDPVTNTEEERPVTAINTFRSPLPPKKKKQRFLAQAVPIPATDPASDAAAQDPVTNTEDARPVTAINTFHSPLPPKTRKKRFLAQAAAASTSVPMATTNSAIDAEAQDAATKTEDERPVTPLNTFHSPLQPKKRKKRSLAEAAAVSTAIPMATTDSASDADTPDVVVVGHVVQRLTAAGSPQATKIKA